MEKENCCKRQTKWYKRVWEKIIIFARWYRPWVLWVNAFLLVIYAGFLCKTSWSFVFYVIFMLWETMGEILYLIAFEPLENE